MRMPLLKSCVGLARKKGKNKLRFSQANRKQKARHYQWLIACRISHLFRRENNGSQEEQHRRDSPVKVAEFGLDPRIQVTFLGRGLHSVGTIILQRAPVTCLRLPDFGFAPERSEV
jgi:hypothetical protein